MKRTLSLFIVALIMPIIKTDTNLNELEYEHVGFTMIVQRSAVAHAATVATATDSGV